jgi:hypothetical protein
MFHVDTQNFICAFVYFYLSLCLLACARFEKKKKKENPRGGHGSEKGVITVPPATNRNLRIHK